MYGFRFSPNRQLGSRFFQVEHKEKQQMMAMQGQMNQQTPQNQKAITNGDSDSRQLEGVCAKPLVTALVAHQSSTNPLHTDV